jgi:zinc protease
MTTILALLAAAGGGGPGAGAGAAPRTVLQPSATNPLVAIRLVFRTGAVDDPKGKEGLAELCAEMLERGGSKARTYAEALDALYPLAADIHVHSDEEVTVIFGTVHKDKLEAYSKILLERVLTPRFADDDFARNKQDALDEVEKTLRGNEDEELGKESMATMLYPGQPYGRPTTGTISGLKSITLDDVKTFYQTHYTRDRLIVGLGGGYPETFAKGFVAELSALPAKGAARVKVPAPPKSKGGGRILIVERFRPAAGDL